MSDVKESADECLKGWKVKRKEGRREEEGRSVGEGEGVDSYCEHSHLD